MDFYSRTSTNHRNGINFRNQATTNEIKQFKKAILEDLLIEYCANTSIHGVKYLGSSRKALIEKCVLYFIL